MGVFTMRTQLVLLGVFGIRTFWKSRRRRWQGSSVKGWPERRPCDVQWLPLPILLEIHMPIIAPNLYRII
jgi:heme/copper-type cytochrome/quinol oxidase subunit 2